MTVSWPDFSIHQLILRQLPDAVRALLNIEVFTDPYFLRTEVKFLTKGGEHIISASMDRATLDGRHCAYKIPDEVVSFICLRAAHIPKTKTLEEQVDEILNQ